MFEIPTDVYESPRRLTQAVLQVAALLGLYDAELARALKLLCRDIGHLSSGQALLRPDTPAWLQALHFIELYRSLYRKFDGEGAAMCHWLRAHNAKLEETPLLMIVDHGKLEEVLMIAREIPPPQHPKVIQ